MEGRRRESIIRWAALVCLLALTAPLLGQQPPAAGTFGITAASEPEPGILTAGQPTEEQLAAVRKAGYRTVVDLRPADEPRGFDEPKAARDLGFHYVNLPVTPATLDDAKIDRFIDLMNTAPRPLFLHCSSANRVGALYYAFLVLDRGIHPEEALAKARAVGLHHPEMIEKVTALVAARERK